MLDVVFLTDIEKGKVMGFLNNEERGGDKTYS